MKTTALTTLRSSRISSAMRQGFTLIELLIVIAILGVLAAVVLAAINPLEQLAKSRDAGRIGDVSQLGHLMQAYVTTQQAATTWPAAAAGWQATYLVTNSSSIQAPIDVSTLGGYQACGAAANLDHGICYTPAQKTVANDTGLIWTNLESQGSKGKAGCTAAQFAIAVYDSSQGKAGVACVAALTTVPAVGISIF